jgi:hypothetical protein
MTERRYSEEEVAAIFTTATDAREVGRRALGTGSGMTLAELQEIGREVGIPAEAVAHAASLVGQSGQPTSRRFLGLPLGVGRTVELGRPLTEAEWERLVVDLRETFDARGRVSSHGSFRQWTNGNLQALLEPTENGHRFRIKTMSGRSRALMMTGIGVVGVAGAALISATIAQIVGAEASAGSVALMGLGAFALGAIPLPGWARQRRRQMDEIIARLVQTVGAEPRELPAPEHKETPGT